MKKNNTYGSPPKCGKVQYGKRGNPLLFLGLLLLGVGCELQPAPIGLKQIKDGSAIYTMDSITQKKQGAYKSEYEDSKPKEEGTFHQGVKYGVWKYYERNGKFKEVDETASMDWRLISIVAGGILLMIWVFFLKNKKTKMDLTESGKASAQKAHDDFKTLLLDKLQKQNIIPFVADKENTISILSHYQRVTERFKHIMDSLQEVVRETDTEMTLISNVNELNDQIKSLGDDLEQWITARQNAENQVVTLTAKVTELSQQNMELTQTLQRQWDNPPINIINPFTCELHLSAGPRKSERDPDLGEDVAGFRIQKDAIFFWLLDGTSDLSILRADGVEYFSSRLLAQFLAYHLKKGYAGDYKSTDLQDLWEKAVQDTAQDLSVKVKDYMERLSAPERQKLYNKTYNIGTVGIIGVLNAQGDMKAIRIGDSHLHIIQKGDHYISTILNKNPREQDDTQFFALNINYNNREQLTPSLQFNKTRTTAIEGLSNVQQIVVHSDGVGAGAERYMQQVMNKTQYNEWMKQLAQIPQRTKDDKSFLFISIA